MNSFKYQDTAILKSELDFTRVKTLKEFSGEANLSTSVGIPNDLEKQKKIRCAVELMIGGDNERIKIFLKTVSIFEIENIENADLLHKEAKLVCLPKAIEELSKKLAELTRIHVGTELRIPLPQITE